MFSIKANLKEIPYKMLLSLLVLSILVLSVLLRNLERPLMDLNGIYDQD